MYSPNMYTRRACSSCGQRVWTDRASAAPALADASESAESAPPPVVAQCRRCAMQLRSLGPPGQQCPICLEVATEPTRYARVSNESWNNIGERCMHRFCQACLRRYIVGKIEEGAWTIRCPGEGCGYFLLDADIKKFVADASESDDDQQRERSAAILQRYRELRSVDHGEHLRAMLVESLPECEEDPRQWLQSECQACPRCLVIVRKEEGCNHMHCRCGAEFCYGCGAPKDVGPHRCRCICGTLGDGRKLAAWLRVQGRL